MKFSHSLFGMALPFLAFALVVSCDSDKYEFAGYYDDLPFEMGRVHRPDIPENRVNIVDYGGAGDGETLNTEAFASAVRDLSEQGGGHLIVPEGVWLTGPIGLESHIDLHLEEGALIKFSPDRELYPIIETVFEGLDTRRCESPIYADGKTDVSISGSGTIDGSGEYWRPLKKNLVSNEVWASRLAIGGFVSPDGGRWFPDREYWLLQHGKDSDMPVLSSEEEFWETFKSALRPVMVSLRNCENVLLEGCTFSNSPCWNIHPLMCRNVIVKDVKVTNPPYAQNGDGIDVDSCEDVLIVDSTFDVGDDAICVKSGKDEDGRRRARPSRGVICKGCKVNHGHGGFVVGSEVSAGASNIMVSDCDFEGTERGLRFKSKRGRGGVCENIFIEDVRMKDIVADAILFDLYYSPKAAPRDVVKQEAMPVDSGTPIFRNIHIRNIECNGAGTAMFFNGLPEMPVSGVEISDCRISSDRGIDIRYSRDVILNNVSLTIKEGKLVDTAFVNGIQIN